MTRSQIPDVHPATFSNGRKHLNKLVIKICQWVPLTYAFLADVSDVRSKQSAWELSGKFEGDIALSENQLRNGLMTSSTRWPNRTVPYVIDNVFSEYPADICLCPRYMRDVEVDVQHDQRCIQKEIEQIDFRESLLPFSSESTSDVENTCGHNMLQFTRGNEPRNTEQSKFRV
jgi:hypothetical protein